MKTSQIAAKLPSVALTISLVATAPVFTQAMVTNIAIEADTFIVARSPANNVGGGTHVAVGRDGSAGDGRRRGLFRFDLSGIPPGAVVISATFRASVVGAPLTGSVNSTFALHRVAAEWGEGDNSVGPFPQQGSPASTGEVTWNSRQHGIAAWSAGGGDYDATAAASTFVSGVGSYAWADTGLVAVVQGWIDDPSANHGVIMFSQLEGTGRTARKFGSREGGTPSILEVAYAPPDDVSIAITEIGIGSNGLSLAWNSDPSHKYDVLYSRNLVDTDGWLIADANIGAATNGTNVWMDPPYLADPQNPDNAALFYRIGVQDAGPHPLGLDFETIASGLTAPTVLTHAGDGSGRLFIAEQTGEILVVGSGGGPLPTPFLDISDKMTNLTVFGAFGHSEPGINPFYDERGLLGLTFHPEYEANGRLFVYYSSPKSGAGINHESVLAEYHVSATNANVANASSESVILRVDQPEFNHNAGQIAFGPDGFLYVGLGDGGGAGDVHGSYGNGQNISNLLGTIVRIDVDSATPYAVPLGNPFVGRPGADEIFAYGFRNPYRFSFDRAGTNGLVVADVGQNLWEEINVVTNGGNYGWRIMEGNHAFDTAVAATVGVDIAALDFPIHDYKHGPLGISIIGGYFCRGTNYPALAGSYVFGDFSTSFGAADGKLYYLSETRTNIWERFEFSLPGNAPLGRYVKGFGEGEDGELYLLSTTALGPSGTSGDVRGLKQP